MRKILLNKNLVIAEYLKNNKSTKKIGEMFGCSQDTILKNLKSWNIDIRNHSEHNIKHGKSLFQHYCIDCNTKIDWRAERCKSCSNKIKKHKNNCKCAVCKSSRKETFGKNNPCYRGGKTALQFIIRTMGQYSNWVKQIFERDNYTCQNCLKRGGNLEAHHIKPFSLILKEFIQQYHQFSPIEDKETLVRLAITFQPFWDTGNGITLCEICHKKTFKGIKNVKY